MACEKGLITVTKDLEYFNYLKKRGFLGKLFRKYMFTPIVKQFEGKVLDAGCGLGEFLSMYKDSIGIDMNKYCVNYCKGNGLKAHVGNVEKIPFKKDSFNGVLCSHVFEHLKNPMDTLYALTNLVEKKGYFLTTGFIFAVKEKIPMHLSENKNYNEIYWQYMMEKFNLIFFHVTKNETIFLWRKK